MVQICPRCGGLDVGCPVCDAPPMRGNALLEEDCVRSAPLFPEVETAWEVQGIDVSAWNGVMDFSITKTKCQFVIVRLGYGNGWKDSRCDEYRRQLLDIDMPYGVYWYNKAGQDIILHTDGFYRVASEYPFQLSYTEDWEWTSLDKLGTLNWIMAYDQRLRGLIGSSKRTRPYSNANFWNGNVAPNTYFQQEHFVANWTLGSVPFMPNGWPWSEGDDWQWSADNNGKGAEYGMVRDGDPDMDLIRHYGTCTSFNTRFGTHIAPIGQTQPPPVPDFFYANGTLNIRSTPDSRPYANNLIGSMKLDSKWKPYTVVWGYDDYGGAREWWKINEYAYVAKWRTRW